MTASFHPGKHYLSVGFFDKDRDFIEWVELCESFDVDSFYADGRIFQPRLGSTISQIEWH
jgi:lipopolysaccharide transport system ATP-binding protein